MKKSVAHLRKKYLGRGSKNFPETPFHDISELTRWHFHNRSEPHHINRVGLTLALRELNERPALILETGTSAWGTDSSSLFASYVKSFGGAFYTVDIRSEPSRQLGNLGERVHTAVGDSVQFLNGFAIPTGYGKVDLAYLDSWDLDVDNPEPAMEHGLREWQALEPLLGPGSIVVIDDTPIEGFLLGEAAHSHSANSNVIPGKGSLVLKDAAVLRHFRILYHHYNVVLKWDH